MKKLLIFDLDGVLISTKEMHYNAFNDALEKYGFDPISPGDHIKKYDGLKTYDKINLLAKEIKNERILTESKKIWYHKQRVTEKYIDLIKPNYEIIKTFKYLKDNNFIIDICSNSIRTTTNNILYKLLLTDYIHYAQSNEDVKNSKPNPDMFWRSMIMSGVLPEETLIFEDSPVGLLAAKRSGADFIRINSPDEITIDNMKRFIQNPKIQNIPKWKDDKLNVVIPMAGSGSRFAKAGYTFPKPLIDVNGKPMIQVVVENLNIDANFIYIVQKEHRQKYNLNTVLNIITPGCTIIETDGLTEGAACTVLLAKDYFNNNNPLLISNSDQFIEWNSNEFFYKVNNSEYIDGCIPTFESIHPKWSYARLVNDHSYAVDKVAEKNPISTHATCGLYYWKKGKDFVKFTQRMIQQNDRVNNEFYIAPVYNYAIENGRVVIIYPIEKMWGLGTPEDLNTFLMNKN